MAKDEKGLLAAYLINGDDHLKRDRAITRMKIRLEKSGDLSFNLDTFDGTGAQASQIVDACKTLPFASEKRLVLVTAAEKLSKDSQGLLSEYLKDPNPTTVLLLVSDSLPKNSKLYKAVSSVGPKAVIDCSPVKARELASHVRELAPSHGIAITQGAASALVELVGEDTLHLNSELEKLAIAFSEQGEITEQNVRDMVSRVREPKPWDLVDAFSARDAKATMDVLSRMDSASPHALLRQCVTRIRELICAKCMMEENSFSAAALAKELGMQDWRVKRHGSFASRFSLSELEDALESSLYCEREMKSGADPDAAFKEWLLGVVSGKGAPTLQPLR